MVDFSEKHFFLKIFEELLKTRCAYTRQSEMAKQDWCQRGKIGQFHGTLAGQNRTDQMVDLSEKHFLEMFEELIKTGCAYTRESKMAKPEWYQYGRIGQFQGTLAGWTRWLI